MSTSYQKFFTNEIQAVRFGSKQDSILSIIVILISILSCNIILGSILYGMLPRDVRTIVLALKVYKNIFLSNQQFVGVLLIGWVISYNLVSLFIHSHYEMGERYSSDDFYVKKFPMSQLSDPSNLLDNNGNDNNQISSDTEPTLIIHPPHGHISLGIRK